MQERIQNMKKGLLMLIAAAAFTTAAFAYDYDTKVPVPGKTLADVNYKLICYFLFMHTV